MIIETKRDGNGWKVMSKCKHKRVRKGVCQDCGAHMENSVYHPETQKKLGEALPKNSKEFEEWCKRMGITL